MLPEFEPRTGYLPPGIHEAIWDEIEQRYGGTARRRELLDGLKRALRELKAAGCRRAYIDGSFVTAKRNPADFDGCWELDGVNIDLLDPVLWDFGQGRWKQKQRYLGEMLPARVPGNLIGTVYLDYFQQDRDGRRKGIVAIDLEGWP